MNGLHGIVFSYDRQPDLRELAEQRMPASVPFGGSYRAIDFTLSNFYNAGMTDVGVVLHGNYQSLLDHLGNGKIWDMSRKYGGLRLLPPFADNRTYSAAPFRGKMEALAGVRAYLEEEIRQEYVVLSEGDLIINYPLDEVFAAHLESGADITAVCTPECGQKQAGGISFRLDPDNRITKTYSDAAVEGGYRSLEIYILSRDLLLRLTDECAAQEEYCFGKDVLIGKSSRLRLYGYVWRGYSAHLRSVKEYYDRSMDLLRPEIRKELFDPRRPILAKVDDGAASYLAPGSSVRRSIVADGCTIEGSVEDSIIFPGARVERGASVRGSILFKDVVVEENAELSCVIADKNVRVSAGHRFVGQEKYPVVVSRDNTV